MYESMYQDMRVTENSDEMRMHVLAGLGHCIEDKQLVDWQWTRRMPKPCRWLVSRLLTSLMMRHDAAVIEASRPLSPMASP